MAIEWSGLSPGLLVRLDRSASQPLRAQLEASLREAIRGGRSAPGNGCRPRGSWRVSSASPAAWCRSATGNCWPRDT